MLCGRSCVIIHLIAAFGVEKLIQRIVNRITSAVSGVSTEDAPEIFINTCEAALHDEEIYCPRENIDRRDEFTETGLSPQEIISESLVEGQ